MNLDARAATPEGHELARWQEAIARFPNLTTEERVKIFEAIEMAPVGKAAFVAAREINLASGDDRRSFLLHEAVRFMLWPSREQILGGLNYAAGILAR